MKKNRTFKKIITFVVAIALLAACIPANAIKVSASTEIAFFNGEISPGQTLIKSFSVSSPVAVKMAYGSLPTRNDNPAPVTYYIDGSKIDTTDGFNTRTKIWNFSRGTHTIKVVCGSNYAGFAIDMWSF